MAPIKLMFFLISASFLSCCNETKSKKVENQQIIPLTDTITPINNTDTAKITNAPLHHPESNPAHELPGT